MHVALVTGASRGIGASIAERLAREGVAVVAASRDERACAEVVRKVASGGGKAWSLALDVADATGIVEGVAAARKLCESVGPIDWLVNNAGIAESAPFLDHTRECGRDLYERHMDTNFHGPRRLIEALVPDMLQRKYGRVVNVGSSAGLHGYPYAAAYGASKHALVGYSVAAAQELARTGVTMNLVCPHYVDSPMTDASIARIASKTARTKDDLRRFFAAQNPGGTLVRAEEVAEMVWHFAAGGENGAIVELLGGEPTLSIDERRSWRRLGEKDAKSRA